MNENVNYNKDYLTKFNEPFLSIILPVYNEEKSIKTVIYRIPETLNYEVIIVDDGSTDKTIQYVKEIQNPNIQILNVYGTSPGLRKVRKGTWSKLLKTKSGTY